jgi:hypothetical protein
MTYLMTYNALELNSCSYIVSTRLSRMLCPRSHPQHLQLQSAQTNSNHSVPNRLSRRVRSPDTLAVIFRWIGLPDSLAGRSRWMRSLSSLAGFTRSMPSPYCLAGCSCRIHSLAALADSLAGCSRRIHFALRSMRLPDSQAVCSRRN